MAIQTSICFLIILCIQIVVKGKHVLNLSLITSLVGHLLSVRNVENKQRQLSKLFVVITSLYLAINIAFLQFTDGKENNKLTHKVYFVKRYFKLLSTTFERLKDNKGTNKTKVKVKKKFFKYSSIVPMPMSIVVRDKLGLSRATLEMGWG